MQTTDKFEMWAIVEVMGHRRFAGFVTEQALGGASFVRIDVPAVQVDGKELPPFTKLIGAGSIYAISPCTEETAKAFAVSFRARSFNEYEAPRLPAPDPTPTSTPDDDVTCLGCGMHATQCDCDEMEEFDDDDTDIE